MGLKAESAVHLRESYIVEGERKKFVAVFLKKRSIRVPLCVLLAVSFEARESVMRQFRVM